MTKHYIVYDDNANVFLDENGRVYNMDGVMPSVDLLRYKMVGGTYYTQTHEIDFPIRDLNRIIHYSTEFNMFFDEEGDIVYNIFAVVAPSVISLFRKKKVTMVVNGISGGLVEIRYGDTMWDGIQ